MQHRDVWITGVCLVSSIADGAEEHWIRLQNPIAPSVAELRASGFLIHPLPATDFSSQISNPLDLKRMGPMQALGIYAAGRALTSAGLKSEDEILSSAAVIVSGAGGERDIAFDEAIFCEPTKFSDPATLNKRLSDRMRPSLFLSQLPNLLAGHISILFGVTGGSRTTIGEELAGVNAIKLGHQLTADGTYDVALVGGAFNAARLDLLLLYGFGQYLWQHDYRPVWSRSERGGGCILGTMAAFLVLEAAEHAVGRGFAPWCHVCGVATRHTPRDNGDVAKALDQIWEELEPLQRTGSLAIISGATGVSPATEEELAGLSSLATRLGGAQMRIPGSIFGHGMEASFPFNLGLAALALRNGRLYPPFLNEATSDMDTVSRLLVTSVGHFRGEAAALLTAVEL